MNVEIRTETLIFLFWEYLFRNFGILSLQCGMGKRPRSQSSVPWACPSFLSTGSWDLWRCLSCSWCSSGALWGWWSPSSFSPSPCIYRSRGADCGCWELSEVYPSSWSLHHSGVGWRHCSGRRRQSWGAEMECQAHHEESRRGDGEYTAGALEEVQRSGPFYPLFIPCFVQRAIGKDIPAQPRRGQWQKTSAAIEKTAKIGSEIKIRADVQKIVFVL